MTEDELQMRFELVRQAIATWNAETAGLVAAASQRQLTGERDEERIAWANKALEAVCAERDGLIEAATAVPDRSGDLSRGIEIALNELDLIGQTIAAQLEKLQ
ncbi:hypothetical protein ACFSX5_16865 [Devosia albogilva]|uniref:Uncharacterized protein n=1 Tax=Devosia albogilva TaxID=429726 RepID=A0ABW5QPU2_9HYPH